MLQMRNLERQHTDIRALVATIQRKVKDNQSQEAMTLQVQDIVKDINALTGKLKVHMSTEDKFLYPDMRASDNAKLRNAEKKYSNEMQEISQAFVDYSKTFNTRSRVLADTKAFVSETNRVLGLLVKRLDREDHELYPLVKGQ